MAALGTEVNFKRFELTQILVLSGEANFCGVKLNQEHRCCVTLSTKAAGVERYEPLHAEQALVDALVDFDWSRALSSGLDGIGAGCS
jgi:hypothetical protein